MKNPNPKTAEMVTHEQIAPKAIWHPKALEAKGLNDIEKSVILTHDDSMTAKNVASSNLYVASQTEALSNLNTDSPIEDPLLFVNNMVEIDNV
ncbi:hypothetical protein ACH5RR_002885 [Cinchona calisaya]|uniref:Uncharacterized protein n=1 Tax=Cinchona calisaya TaxID=153742 RepID=A0ABD3ATU2_9GENT